MSDSVLITLITGVGTLIGIVLTGYVNIRLGKIHKQLNSRMEGRNNINADSLSLDIDQYIQDNLA